MKPFLTIGSRGSRLALWQAEWVKSALAAHHPQLEVKIEIIKTTGDALKNVSLSVIGGQGVFTKELEEALLDGRIDLAVHSLKDLPTQLPAELALAAITEREDARDALVLRENAELETHTLRQLPSQAIVGTSSPRRLAQLKHLRPDVQVKDLRGNVDTRLRKLDEGSYDAVILAAAGLRRLGWASRLRAYLETEEMLPAVGQGALGIETRAADALTMELVRALDHAPTRAACVAERALLRGLGGGCQLPIAAHAVVHENHLSLDGLVAGTHGEQLIRERVDGAVEEAARLGQTLAESLLTKGAVSLLKT
ncbi:MAG: hydroxymethylbilane synthase [Acidobacteria bacterium]|nr:hydroxymethylbilane synthase [Acidobacteriota bacterium]